MKETKVYMKLPENCFACPFMTDNQEGHDGCFCKLLDERAETKNRVKDCPLIDIKAHDREKDKRIKELEQKVQELQEVDNKRAFRLYSVLYNVLEKQDPENVASRIDYLTGKDYSEMCELYKTAKNLKQHDLELVKEVCEKIKLKFSDTRTHNWGIEQFELYEFLDQIQKEFEK